MNVYCIANVSTREMVVDAGYYKTKDKAIVELVNYPGCFVDTVDVCIPNLPYGAVSGNTIKFPKIELNKEDV